MPFLANKSNQGTLNVPGSIAEHHRRHGIDVGRKRHLEPGVIKHGESRVVVLRQPRVAGEGLSGHKKIHLPAESLVEGIQHRHDLIAGRAIFLNEAHQGAACRRKRMSLTRAVFQQKRR